MKNISKGSTRSRRDTDEIGQVPRRKGRFAARQEREPAPPPAAATAAAPGQTESDFSAGILDEGTVPAPSNTALTSNESEWNSEVEDRVDAPTVIGEPEDMESLDTPHDEDAAIAADRRHLETTEIGQGEGASRIAKEGERGAEEKNEDQPRRRRRRRGGRGRRRRDDETAGDVVDGSRDQATNAAREQTAPDTESPTTPPEHDVDFDQDEVPEEAKLQDVEEEEAPAARGRSRTARPSSKVEKEGEEEDHEQREMLINVSDVDEVRIALLREGRLDELYIERTSAISNVGNIYKGKIMNVEPSIQAAFIDFGLPVHGFLHISDLHPKYFPESKGGPELVGRKTPRRNRPPIQNCLRRGQEVIVQVIKEGIGTKGPTLSTYLSLPGRFLVMMPGMDQLGVSRKIEDEEQRRKLRDVLAQLTLPKEMGFIVRTAGIDRTKRDLQRDLNYLARLWSNVAKRMKSEPAPAELYKESDLVIRTIRDVYDSSLKRILVDNQAVADRVREFLAIASPRTLDVVEVYGGPEPMFHRFGMENEIEKLHSKNVPLPCGGSLVIEQTEALVAIDVNSGRFRVPENAEETAFRVNQEAADEIARQLRLRDLGGLVICDFIDMTHDRHRRAIEQRLSEALKKHKERAKLLRISRFGILEMTRQRQRPSFAKSMFGECPRCHGSGRVRAIESVCLDVMRDIQLASQREGVTSIDVRTTPAVANDLLNRKRHAITDMERAKGQSIRIHGDPNFGADQPLISCTDRRGREVPAFTASPNTGPRLDRVESGGQRPSNSRPLESGGRHRRRGRRGRGSRGREGGERSDGGVVG